tara:strand:+ start:240852 stop:241109 length:258 start_codon:yes stop_codon:yes gene_type:complete
MAVILPAILLTGWFIFRNWPWFMIWAVLCFAITQFWFSSADSAKSLAAIIFYVQAGASVLGGAAQGIRLVLMGEVPFSFLDDDIK